VTAPNENFKKILCTSKFMTARIQNGQIHSSLGNEILQISNWLCGISF